MASQTETSDGISVLLIDDSRPDFEIVRSYLELIDPDRYRVHWQASPPPPDTLPQYDLVILDRFLGCEDGLDYLRGLAGRESMPPVIMLTGDGSFDADYAASRAGAADFIEKNRLDERLLERAIRYALLNHEKLRLQETLTQTLAAKKQVEVRLDEATRSLIHSEKMVSIGQLAAGVAHEINNPLGFVSSNVHSLEYYCRQLQTHFDAYAEAAALCCTQDRARLESLMHDTTQGEFFEDIFDIVRESMEGLHRIKVIVADLKDFCHQSEETTEKVDLNAAVSSTLNILRNETKYTTEVVFDQGDVGPIEANTSKINQVIMNLVVNAVQAIRKHPQGTSRNQPRKDGRHQGKAPRGEIRLRTYEEAGKVCLLITDNGCGMPPEIRRRIFEPFFTTKPLGEGTGLGLSIAYGIVEDCQGSIFVTSQPGQGTTFRLEFPKTRENEGERMNP